MIVCPITRLEEATRTGPRSSYIWISCSHVITWPSHRKWEIIRVCDPQNSFSSHVTSWMGPRPGHSWFMVSVNCGNNVIELINWKFWNSFKIIWGDSPLCSRTSRGPHSTHAILLWSMLMWRQLMILISGDGPMQTADCPLTMFIPIHQHPTSSLEHNLILLSVLPVGWCDLCQYYRWQSSTARIHDAYIQFVLGNIGSGIISNN